MRKLSLALALLFLAGPALAVPEQMLRQIDQRLRFYFIEVDVHELTNAQATAIWFELTSEPEHRVGDRLRKRQRILNIIRKGKDF